MNPGEKWEQRGAPINRCNWDSWSDRHRDSDNPGIAEEMGSDTGNMSKSPDFFRQAGFDRIWPTPRTAGYNIFMDWQSELSI
ncbi:hypothetical protein Tco_0940589 [Tanacetum coccineum]|uniref:Uncharacterized protein n=1 Tax=Tanacetum coccineum TaxID=301880 RepID=A0ABQ5DUI1_9ASTR